MSHASGGAAYPHLLSPLALGTRTVRNRIALPATLTNYGVNNRITDRWTAFLVERARGGAGLVTSEVVAVDPNAIAQSSVVTGFDEANAGGFRRTADAIHEAGALFLAQLWHPGRQQLWHPTTSPMGVSDQPDAYSWTVPHVMSGDEIRAVVAAYVATAECLAGYGLDGVELHGAHGYLLTQFLSPWSNTRTDGYGGSLENRARVVREIAAGIRAACGRDFVVGLKMPGDEGVAGGIDVEEAAAITAHLAPQGLFDYLAYGQGNFSLSLENHVPDMSFPPAPFVEIHRRMREVAGGVPVLALGRIGTPALAERIVAEGHADLIGMSRALVADAAFGRKAAAGEAALIRPSTFDNWCWGEIHAGRALREHHNPHLAEAGEADFSPPPASSPRHVVVVGAGPGGLETAWVAAARGHRVTLLGASPGPGGKLRLEAAFPARAEMGRIVDHQVALAMRHLVRMQLGETVSAQTVRALSPDVVVLATGARLRPPWAPRAEDGPMLSLHEYVQGHATCPPDARSALLFDMDHGAAVYACADLLAAQLERVVLMTPRPQLAQRVNYCSAIGVHRRLFAADVEVLLAGEPVAFAADTVRWVNPYTGRERELDGIDLLVYATPRIVEPDLGEALADLELHRVGDCQSPRDLMAAIHGGHALALRL